MIVEETIRDADEVMVIVDDSGSYIRFSRELYVYFSDPEEMRKVGEKMLKAVHHREE